MPRSFGHQLAVKDATTALDNSIDILRHFEKLQLFHGLGLTDNLGINMLHPQYVGQASWSP
jgi:hypothetical protein